MVSPVPLILLFAMASCVLGVPTENGDLERVIGRSSEQFAASVYQDIKGTKTGNLLICPLSVQTVLALVQAGAKNQTSDEIGRAVNLPEDKTITQRGFKKLMKSLTNANGVTLDIANKVYTAMGFPIDVEFERTATENFNADVENVNFAENFEAAQVINQWVEKKTNDKIKDLISPDDLDSLTRMVLVNALYFKGKWKSTFDTYLTSKRDFYLNEQDKVKVDMMSQTSWFSYAENTALDCKFLELPYQGDEFVMTIVLPNQKNGLAALENKMAEVFAPQQYRLERVEVLMPKFKVEETIDFTAILKSLGMVIPFTEKADFSDLSTNKEPLYISKVIQKNFINVTEEGTEAASATAVRIVPTSLQINRVPPPKIYIDHPFLFTLGHKKSNTILFQGRITLPSVE